MNLNPEKLARMIDYAFLKPYCSLEDMEKHAEEALQYRFAMVAIHPADIEFYARRLSGSPVHVGAVVGFPLGRNTPEVKAYETRNALERGAQEIDLMINLRALQAGELGVIRQEIASLVKTCRKAGATNKVILETCYLSDDEKITACRIALNEGADFVKTSTGFSPKGATVHDVRLLRSIVGRAMGVKAAGGIRTLNDALRMIEAGADRLGTSNGARIMEEALASGLDWQPKPQTISAR